MHFRATIAALRALTAVSIAPISLPVDLGAISEPFEFEAVERHFASIIVALPNWEPKL